MREYMYIQVYEMMTLFWLAVEKITDLALVQEFPNGLWFRRIAKSDMKPLCL